MLRVPWQQQMTPDSMMKLSISGMAQHNSTSLPEAISMLSVRSNHSGRSSHSARSGHTHSDALSQKAVVEVAMATMLPARLYQNDCDGLINVWLTNFACG